MQKALSLAGAVIGALAIWMVYEIKNAPEMYYAKDGSFRKKEWFEENGETGEMYYDPDLLERYPYEYFARLEERE